MSTDVPPPEAPTKKRKGKAPIAQMTRDYYRGLGYEFDTVERWIEPIKRRLDMFGFADYIAMREGSGIIAVQATDHTSHANHRTKILAEPRALTWLKSGGRIELITWRKRPVAVMGKWWTCRREEIKVEDFA